MWSMQITQNIRNLWYGDVPLVKTFWIYGVGVYLLLIIIPRYYFISEKLYLTPELFNINIVHFVLTLVYVVFIIVSIGRSIQNYEGLKIYKFLAFLLIAHFLYTIVNAAILIYSVWMSV